MANFPIDMQAPTEQRGPQLPIDYTPTVPVERPENIDAQILRDSEDESVTATTARIMQQANEGAEYEIATILADTDQDPELAAQELEGYATTQQESTLGTVSNFDELYLEDAAASYNSGYSNQSLNISRNLQILREELLLETSKYEDRGRVMGALSWIDYNIARGLFNAVEGITNRTSRQGDAFRDFITSADPETARKEFRERIQAGASEGVLPFVRGYGLKQVEREAFSFGYNPDENLDAFFGVFDLATIGYGAAVSRPVRGAVKLFGMTPATRAGAVGGRAAANEVAERALKSTDDMDTMTEMGSSLASPNTGNIRPAISIVNRVDEDTLLRRQMELEESGAIPTPSRAIDKNTVLTRAMDTYKPIVGSRLIDIELGQTAVDTAGEYVENQTIRVVVGTTKGNDFKSAASAQRQAETFGGVVEETADGKWRVVIESTAFDESAFTKTLNTSVEMRDGWAVTKAVRNTMSDVLNRFLSATSRDVDELAESALVGQGAERALTKARYERVDAIRGLLGVEGQNAMNQVLDELGKRPVKSNADWDYGEFVAEWKAQGFDIPDPQKLEDAFYIAKDLSDTAYINEARMRLQRAMRNGYTQAVEIGPNFRTAAKRVDANNVPDNAKVYNGKSDSVVPFSDLKGDFVVFKLGDNYKTGVDQVAEYVVYPSTVGPVRSTDVLGYVAYGRRTNKDIKNFLTLVGDDGTTRALVGGRTTNQSVKALKQLKNIANAIRKGRTGKELDRTIQQNNEFNPNIESLADLKTFLASKRLSMDAFLNGRLVAKERGEMIQTNTSQGDLPIEEAVNYDMSRSDFVLAEYGGTEAISDNPLSTIVRQVANTQKAWSFNYYTHQAAMSWMAKAEEMAKDLGLQITYRQEVSEGDVIRKFENAEIVGNSDFARQFREAQRIFALRRFKTTDFDKKVSAVFESALDKLFDAGFEKTADGARKLFEGIDRKMMTFAYYKSFWGDISQIYMQSSGMLSALALAREGVGLRGAVTQRTMRKIMALSANSAEEKVLLARLGKQLDLSEQDMQELAQIWREFNPHIVMGDIMEMGGGLGLEGLAGRQSGVMRKVQENFATQTTNKLFNSAKEIGMKPFNWGEANTRSTAFQIAALEFKKLNPDLSLMSETGRRYVSKRTETLSLNMSAASKANIQQGLMAVPTQFLTHFFRAHEMVFLGRDLTRMERAKLFTVLAPIYGTTGLPFADDIADFAAQQIGLDMENEQHKDLYIGIKYGIFDFMMASTTQVETAVATRLSTFGMYSDLYEKVFVDRDFAGILGGPSGEMIAGPSGVISVVSNATRRLFVNHGSTFNEDTLNLLRQFKGARNIVDAIGVFNEGVLRNTKGDRLDLMLDPLDAVTVFAGFSPVEKQEYYDLLNDAYEIRTNIQKYRNTVREEVASAYQRIADGDLSGGVEHLDTISLYIDTLPVSQEAKRSLRNMIRDTPDERVENALETIMRNEVNTYTGRLSAEMIGGNVAW